MEITNPISKTLEELKACIQGPASNIYASPCTILDGISVGKHVRHIIELFQCLQNQYPDSFVNYDMRERNTEIENSTETAIAAIDEIISRLNMPNKDLAMTATFENGIPVNVNSNYHRELLYNFEHCIHHMALIKVALRSFQVDTDSPYFGYAPSTINYLNQTQKVS